MHLDPVHAQLDLPPHFHTNLVGRAHHHRIATRTFVRDQPPGGAADRGQQCVASCRHARPFKHIGGDRIAEVHADIEDAVRIQEPGDTRTQQLLHITCRNDCCQAGAPVKEQFIVRRRFIEGDVAMRIDETRHQRGTGGVNAPHVGPVRRIANVTTLAIPGTPHGDDAITLDEYGTNKRRRTQAIQNARVLDQRGHVPAPIYVSSRG